MNFKSIMKVKKVRRRLYGVSTAVNFAAISNVINAPPLGDLLRSPQTIDPNYCKLTYIYHSDETEGNFSSLALNAHLKQQISFVYDVKSFFLQIRTVSELDANDGRELGEALGRCKADNLQEVIEQYKALAEIKDKWQFFAPMLVEVLKHR